MKFYPILLLFCVCCATLSPKSSDPPGRTQRAQQNTSVRVGLLCIDNPTKDQDPYDYPDSHTHWAGSGAIVSDTEVLTVAHVVSCEGTGQRAGIWIKTYTGKITPMLIERYDQESDIALLKRADGGKLGVHTITPRIESAIEGDILCAVTATPKRGWLCGEVKGIDRDGINLSQNVEHGNSGSPVYNLDGALVGIVTSLYTCDGQPCGGRAVAVSSHMDMLP